MEIYDQSKNIHILKNLIVHFPIKFIFSQEYLEYIFACADTYDINDSVKFKVKFSVICLSNYLS